GLCSRETVTKDLTHCGHVTPHFCSFGTFPDEPITVMSAAPPGRAVRTSPPAAIGALTPRACGRPPRGQGADRDGVGYATFVRRLMSARRPGLSVSAAGCSRPAGGAWRAGRASVPV